MPLLTTALLHCPKNNGRGSQDLIPNGSHPQIHFDIFDCTYLQQSTIPPNRAINRRMFSYINTFYNGHPNNV